MANPPDNKNPGSNNPPTPKPTPGVESKKTTVQSGNTGAGGKPALTPGQNTASQTTTGQDTPTRNTPVQNTGTTQTPPAKPATPPPAPRTDTTGVRTGTSAATGATTKTTTGTATRTPNVATTTTPEIQKTTKSSTLERPRPAGTPEPGKRRPNQLTRPARPLERTAEGSQKDRRPPAGRRPEGRPERPSAGRPRRPQNARPAYRDNKPRRRMAPPPGAKKGRYVAPAARPARRGHVIPPAAAAPAGSAWGPLLFGLLLLLGVLWYAIKHYAPMINSDLTARTNSALDSAGFDSANVEIDGRDAILSGSVATESDSERAEEVVANTDGVRYVDNQLAIGAGTDTAQAERAQPSLTFLATDDGVKLSGTVSDQEYADQIEANAKEVYGADNVTSSITVDPNSTNPGWWPAVQQLTPDLNNIDGSFTVSNGSIRLTGEAADEQTKDDIGAKAEELLNGQLTIDNRITVATAEPAPAPQPDPEPAPLKPASANYYNTGEAIQLNGSMPSDSAATLADAFANATLPVENNINISDEFEAPAWVGSFAESLEALKNIEQAEVDVQPDGDVAVYGIAKSEDAKQAAADSVATIFADQSVNNQISVRVPEPEPIVPTLQPFASVSDDGTTLTIAGLLSPSAADAIGATFDGSGRTVVSNVTADERVMEPEWTNALADTLQEMQGVENPRIMIAASGDLTISGLADNESIRQQAADASFNAFGNSVSLRNDITVKGPDISELLARIDLAAIRFRSGSSELDTDSVSILEQVATALEQVPNATVAITGHTDSTGSAQRNLVLSGQRADRVRGFLLDRGIGGDRMTSQGFGSNQPIASNDTVTGRALNRRIDIALTNGE